MAPGGPMRFAFAVHEQLEGLVPNNSEVPFSVAHFSSEFSLRGERGGMPRSEQAARLAIMDSVLDSQAQRTTQEFLEQVSRSVDIPGYTGYIAAARMQRFAELIGKLSPEEKNALHESMAALREKLTDVKLETGSVQAMSDSLAKIFAERMIAAGELEVEEASAVAGRFNGQSAGRRHLARPKFAPAEARPEPGLPARVVPAESITARAMVSYYKAITPIAALLASLAPGLAPFARETPYGLLIALGALLLLTIGPAWRLSDPDVRREALLTLDNWSKSGKLSNIAEKFADSRPNYRIMLGLPVVIGSALGIILGSWHYAFWGAYSGIFLALFPKALIYQIFMANRVAKTSITLNHMILRFVPPLRWALDLHLTLLAGAFGVVKTIIKALLASPPKNSDGPDHPSINLRF